LILAKSLKTTVELSQLEDFQYGGFYLELELDLDLPNVNSKIRKKMLNMCAKICAKFYENWICISRKKIATSVTNEPTNPASNRQTNKFA